MKLPNFLIAGVQKSGTTSLYAYLGQHPEVYQSEIKEPHFFLSEELRPWQYYPGQKIRLWDTRITSREKYQQLFAGATDEKAIGEASVWYLYRPEAARRIQKTIPQVKWIVILRNPVERCFSDYKQGLKLGYETCVDFQEAVAADTAEYEQKSGYSFHYVPQGYYAEQLERLFKVFERKQVKILFYEDLCAQPGETMRDVFRFLQIDDAFQVDLSERENVSVSSYEVLNTPNPYLRTVLENSGRQILPLETIVVDESPADDTEISIPKKDSVIKKLTSFVSHENTRKTMISGLLKNNGWVNTETFQPKLAADFRSKLQMIYQNDIKKLEKLTGRNLAQWLR